MSEEYEALTKQIAEFSAIVSALRFRRRQIEIRDGKNERANSPRIAAIKRAYVANHASVADVARSFGTSSGYIQRIAREFGWPRRSPVKVKGQATRREREGV